MAMAKFLASPSYNPGCAWLLDFVSTFLVFKGCVSTIMHGMPWYEGVIYDK